MMKYLNALESTDSISDDASTDASSTRSSYQDPSTFEEVASGSESEDNDSKSSNNSQSAKAQDASSASSGSLATNPQQNKDALFRNNYINKLTNMNIIRQQPQRKSHQTLVIFDWDDTLFPTTFLTFVGFDKALTEAKIQNYMSRIDRHVAKLLQKATKFGKTCIITNASNNWVETSSERYLPHTYEFIRKSSISVVSARSKFEKQFPNEPKRWKQEAFLELKGNLVGTMLTNIICIGDSMLELEAAQHICSALSQAILKTIKFKQAPRIEELMKQQEVVLEKFDQIYMTLKNLTIKVERKN